jgi:hypothetical protein
MRLGLSLLSSLVVTAIAGRALAQPAPAPPPPQPAPPATTAAPPPPDLPPPPPPPWTANPAVPGAPDLTQPQPDASPPGTAPPTAPPVVVVDHGLDKRIAELEHDVTTLRAQAASTPPPDPALTEKLAWLKLFKVSGYLQPQLLWQFFDDNASPNPPGFGPNQVTAKPNGTTTNGDFFRLRRARLKLEFQPSDYARFVFEIDPVLAGGTPGTGTIARNVEAVGIARWSRDVVTEFGMGIFKIPFGYEVLQSDADRPFIERSWTEQNITPGEFDTGARAYTSFLEKRGTFQVALVNGQIQGEPTFSLLPDLNQGKDIVGRASYNFGPVDVGASGMYGQGQNVNAAMLRFKQFPRWAVNGELGFHHTFSEPVGESRLFAEVTYAQNYDRGTKYAFAVPAIPASIGADVANLNELGWWVRVEQDLTKWATLALRYDFYTPDASQATDGRDTFGAVGVVHFTKGLQYMLEYDHATDNVHPAGAPPPSRHIDTISNVFQVRF